MQPFRIYAGWDSRQAEAAEVFGFSVRANASIPVDVEFLKIKELPITRTGTTDFTFSRFLSAWAANFEGVALFADCCDQLCLGDVAELAAIDMTDYAVRVVKHKVNGQKRPRSWSSVMLAELRTLRRLDTRLYRDGARCTVDAVRQLPGRGDRRLAVGMEHDGLFRRRSATWLEARSLVGSGEP